MNNSGTSHTSVMNRKLSITTMLAIGCVTHLFLIIFNNSLLVGILDIAGVILSLVAIISLIYNSAKKNWTKDVKIGWILFLVWIISNIALVIVGG